MGIQIRHVDAGLDIFVHQFPVVRLQDGGSWQAYITRWVFPDGRIARLIHVIIFFFASCRRCLPELLIAMPPEGIAV
jgi:hypothetical protein